MPGKSDEQRVESGAREPIGPAGGSPAAAVGAEVTESGGAPDEHELRLMALLAELVRERGRPGAAEALDLDPRTVTAALKRGTLSRRVRSALERVSTAEGHAEEGGVEEGEPATVASEWQERVEAVGREVQATRELAVEGNAALREEHARDLRQVERRLARLESLLEGHHATTEAAPGGEPVVGGSALPQQGAPPVPRRQYPDLVTREPAGDDAQVYGEAWTLVEEWRGLWQVHERPGRGLAWLRREVRILELEVAMLEEHGLTLPPATSPQRGLELRTHLGWRLQALANRRRARAWAQLGCWLRGGIVFGLLAGVTIFLLLASASS